MGEFLRFRLYGPLASWGETPGAEIRATALHPTRSALLGLVAAALGIDRFDDEAHRELGGPLRFAVRVDAVGVPLVDYHTAQLFEPKKRPRPDSRAHQLDAPRHELKTVVTERHYRADAAYTVVAWQEGEPGRFALAAIGAALAAPHFVLSLGRKSCPPAWPLAPRKVEAETAREAFAVEAPEEREAVERSLRPLGLRPGGIYWDGDPARAGLVSRERHERRDEPTSRRRQTFTRRFENFTPPEVSDAAQSTLLTPLSAGAVAASNLFASPYSLHQGIWKLFSNGEKRTRDFLFRIDRVAGRPVVFTLSERPPRDTFGLWSIATKPFEPDLRSGDRLAFRLRANPTIRRKEPGAEKGKRCDLVMNVRHQENAAAVPPAERQSVQAIAQVEGEAWLTRKEKQHGFSLKGVSVDGYEVHRFPKKGATLSVATCDFDGVLEVTDPVLFQQTLTQGIGSAKGFGCGLLLIKRA